MQTVRGLLRGKGSQVYSISPEASVYDALKIMAEKGVGALVVLAREGELAGIVSIGDVVKAIISEQEFMIEQLENYITGVR